MADLSKEERKQRLRALREAERAELLASMPMKPQQLHKLLGFLNRAARNCDHTTKVTEQFLASEKLKAAVVLPWLSEHGGFCDCEVLANLSEVSEIVREQSTASRPAPKKKVAKEARDLSNVAGWNLESLPSPWKVANRFELKKPVRLQMGKKAGGCSLKVVARKLPIRDIENWVHWAQLWRQTSKLQNRSEIEVDPEALSLPNDLQTAMVSSQDFGPIYCWIYPQDQKWYAQAETDITRKRGDLPEIVSLIKHLETTR